MLVCNVTQVKQLYGVRIIISSAILMWRKRGKGLEVKCFVILKGLLMFRKFTLIMQNVSILIKKQ